MPSLLPDGQAWSLCLVPAPPSLSGSLPESAVAQVGWCVRGRLFCHLPAVTGLSEFLSVMMDIINLEERCLVAAGVK